MNVQISDFAVIFASLAYVFAPLIARLIGPTMDTFAVLIAHYNSQAMRNVRRDAKRRKLQPQTPRQNTLYVIPQHWEVMVLSEVQEQHPEIQRVSIDIRVDLCHAKQVRAYAKQGLIVAEFLIDEFDTVGNDPHVIAVRLGMILDNASKKAKR